MTKVTEDGQRLRRHVPERWPGRINRMVLTCLLGLLAASGSPAQTEGNVPAAPGEFFYKAYSAEEIDAALQRPLTLTDCIGIALSRNIALRVAQRDYASAQKAHAGSYGRFLPVFTLEATRINETVKEDTSETATPSSLVETGFNNQGRLVGNVSLFMPTGATVQFTTDFLHNTDISERTAKTNDLLYSVNLSQPLLRGAGLTAARSDLLSAGYEKRIQEKALLDTKLQTVFIVKSLFYGVLEQRALVKVNENALMRDSILVKSSEALTTAKLASRRDILSAEIRLADDRAALISSQNEYQAVLDELKNAMGLSLDLKVEVAAVELTFMPVRLDEAALVESVLANNPTIQSAELAIESRRLNHKVAKNASLPELNLIAAYTNSSNRDLILARQASETGAWEAGVSLSYPFLNKEASAQAQMAQIAVAQEEDRLQDLKRQIAMNIRNILRNVYSSAEEINAINRSIVAAQQKLDFATAMFNLGRASNKDITDAQESLIKSQSQLLRTLVEYYTQLALLESFTGQPIVL